MANEDIPTYNLKAVVRETGLKPDTLRAWERRYGMPDPDRTGGGHRLYSQRDINTLKWLLARQHEGMSISRAVGLWRNLQEEGRDPFQLYPPISQHTAAAAPSPIELGNTVVDLRRAWVEAALRFDERQAELILNQAFSYYSPEVVCFELLQKALAEMGAGWYEGAISVQQEHFASALALRRLDSLLAATPAPTQPGRIIVGCPPGEFHTFSPLLVTFLLRRRGWDVVYLGADVPINRLQATIEATHTDLVVFSAQLLDTAASLLDAAQSLEDAGVSLAFGGHIFTATPGLAERIPGHYLGDVLQQVPYVIERLALNQQPAPPTIPVTDNYRRAWAYFRERASLIETQLWQQNMRWNGATSDFSDISHYLTRNILSALRLGDLDYVGPNLEWAAGIVSNHHLPPQALPEFMTAYTQAAAHHLSEPEGHLVVDWLGKVTAALQVSPALTTPNR
ncbi:putative MerR family transcriptional regulator [Candidatus Promineifilum breve]|uniref:MerR family transcriptional regulator n=1 Tax=Candidatus Promineifilum breve TaxID=1806508 RepID=A0A160T1S6_9CHLR|nr:MerR family transcriptional regulator [Candidatus Promineifilum breve]CUS02778.2 putative MerR family transcriptional regulator [Candidatus Promineifilum breve]